MENSTGIRRKAQKLTQKGEYADAIVEYEKLSELDTLEPYDLVVFADILSRDGRRNDAVNRYLEAMDAYQNAGLNRNAIALGKKIQRLSPNTSAAHRRLGDLYAADGLGSESCLHYLEYLDKLTGEGDEDSQSIEEISVKLLELSLPSFDVVKRIVDKVQLVDRGGAVVPGILRQAERARAMGNEEAGTELSELAHSLDSVTATEIEQTAATGSENGSEPEAPPLEPGVIDLDQADSKAETEVEATAVPEAAPVVSPGEPKVLSLEGFTLDADETEPSQETPEVPLAEPVVESNDLSLDISLDAEPASSAADPGTPAEEAEPTVYSLDDGGEPKPVAESEVEPGTAAAAEPLAESENKIAKTEGETNPDLVRARGMKFMEENDSMRAQREFMKAAGLYFEAARSSEAGDLFETVVKMDPNHLEALRGLVELAHINGEKAKMAHWGSEFGDVLLAREKYAEAKVQFERVLAFDPHNVKAHARLKRLKTIAGVKDAAFGELAPTPSEVQGAQVTIRDDESGSQSQSALDLTQILDEFRAAVVDRIPADDSQSHYDLGMTYKEMGLIREAAEEFETASKDEENRLASMEMLAECYLNLNRADEAIQIYEQILVQDESSNAQTFLQLGRAREALGQWDQAAQEYNRILSLIPDHKGALDALAQLEHRREQGAA